MFEPEYQQVDIDDDEDPIKVDIMYVSATSSAEQSTITL